MRYSGIVRAKTDPMHSRTSLIFALMAFTVGGSFLLAKPTNASQITTPRQEVFSRPMPWVDQGTYEKKGAPGTVAKPVIKKLASPPASTDPRAFPALKSTDRLTIIAPHPDDETVALGGLIYQARQQRIPVSIIFMTNGDGNEEGASQVSLPSDQASMTKFGALRQQEAVDALAELGVPESDLYFLSLPDDGLEATLSSEHVSVPFLSPLTGLSSTSGYDRAFIKDMPYTGQAAHAALLQALIATRPTRVFVTMREDAHRDHWAAGQYFADIQSAIPSHPRHYSYLVHYPRYATSETIDQGIVPPVELRGRPWKVIAISPEAEAQQRLALQEYRSQLKSENAAWSILNLVRTNELVIL